MASAEQNSGRILEIMKQVITQLREAKDVADLDISSALTHSVSSSKCRPLA